MAGCYYYFHKYYPEYDPVFWCVKTDKTLESPMDSKEIKPVNPKGNQPWLFTGGLMLKLKLQYFGHLMGRANSLEKDPSTGKNWDQEEKGVTEDEMVGWHDRLNGHEFEQTSGDGEGQESLACCSPRGRKELDTTDWVNSSNKDKRIWLSTFTFRECKKVSGR